MAASTVYRYFNYFGRPPAAATFFKLRMAKTPARNLAPVPTCDRRLLAIYTFVIRIHLSVGEVH